MWRALDAEVSGSRAHVNRRLSPQQGEKFQRAEWILLYVERWLKAPMQTADGQILGRDKGTPQGGVITPRTQKVTFIADPEFAV